MEYYEKRQHWYYYRRIQEILEELTIDDFFHDYQWNSTLDVGPADTPVALWGNFRERYTCDVRHNPNLAGVKHFTCDYMDLQFAPKSLSMITCLQVLEHLEDPASFLQKIRNESYWSIISVPYRWKPGTCESHIQDPVTLADVITWAGGEEPVYVEQVQDNSTRLIAVFGPHTLNAQIARKASVSSKTDADQG
jgi:hypothetical protein